jgi:hypothetical protein
MSLLILLTPKHSQIYNTRVIIDKPLCGISVCQKLLKESLNKEVDKPLGFLSTRDFLLVSDNII